jgi:signal transduction histidine kinase
LIDPPEIEFMNRQNTFSFRSLTTSSLFFLLFFLAITQVVSANKTNFLSENQLAPHIRFETSVLKEVPPDFVLESKEHLTQIRDAKSEVVTSMDAYPINLGDVQWFKLTLHKITPPGATAPASTLSGSPKQGKVFFQLRAAHQSEVIAHFVHGTEIEHTEKSGYKVAFSRKSLISPDLILPITDWTDEVAEIYIKTKPESKMPFWPVIRTEKEVSVANSLDLMIVSGYIAILLILLLYQLFIYQTLKDRASLDYSLFCLTMVLSAIARSGYVDMLFERHQGSFYFGDWMIYFVGLNTFTAVQFIRSYFNLNNTSPKIDRGFKGLLLGSFILYVSIILLKPALLHKIVPSVNLLAGVLAILYSIYGLKTKVVGSAYYLAAWGGFIILISYFNLSMMGAMDMPSYMRYLTYFAGLWEAYLTAIGLSHRLSRFKDMEAERDLRNVENSALHRLVRILVHDVANPLTTIQLNTTILRDRIAKNIFEKIPERLDKMTKATNSIAMIIDDVRTFEALRSKKLKPQIESVNLYEALLNASEIFEETCKKKDVQIQLPKFENSFFVLANKNSLQTSVISNIFSNALKFSQHSSKIEISIEQTKSKISFSIQDHGVGMSQELVKSLFLTDSSTSRVGTENEKGTGFGMLLIKEFVESYGGTLEVFSKSIDQFPNDSGTKITVHLQPAMSAPIELEPKAS